MWTFKMQYKIRSRLPRLVFASLYVFLKFTFSTCVPCVKAVNIFN